MSDEISDETSESCYDWFEPLYAQANGDTTQVPWSLPAAAPYLTHWLTKNKVQGKLQSKVLSAVVVGCGLGDDAEALAAAGFVVTAFDVSPSAIAWAQKRFPESLVNYTVADVFQLPSGWLAAFDLVFDFRTIQALPLSVRTEVIEQIAALARPGGTVLIATYVREPEAVVDGPPWPLSAQELAQFEACGLVVASTETFHNAESRFSDRILIQYQAPL